MKKNKNCMRSLLPVFMAAVFAFSAVFGSAFAFAGESGETDPSYIPAPITENGDYSYQVNADGTATITDYNGTDEDVVIPSEIDGYPVSAIGKQAFSYEDMKSLTIPEEVSTISSRAFEYCSITDSLVFPAGIYIGPDSFSYTTLPETVTIPEGAVVDKEAFGYCTGLKTLIIESYVYVMSRAFSYCRNLKTAVCAAQVTLENRAFDNCDVLDQAYLCGDVYLEDNPFAYGGDVEITYAAENEFPQIRDELLETGGISTDDKSDDGETVWHSVEELAFYAPSDMMESDMDEYDLFLVNENFDCLLGTAVFPETGLDFEDDDAIAVMVETAQDYVEVDNAYKIRVCGFPGVWIDIHNNEDSSTGVYLYIDAGRHMYHMMYLSLTDSRDDFADIVNTITIGPRRIGTDLSALYE